MTHSMINQASTAFSGADPFQRHRGGQLRRDVADFLGRFPCQI